MVRRRPLTKFDYNPTKFKELIVYVAQRCADDPTFGSVKLNKILFYADFAAYRQLRQPITGATYRKLSEGPVPKELLEARETLIDSSRLELQMRTHFGYLQKRPVVPDNVAVDTTVFSSSELEIVDETIEFFRGKSAREVSDYSHREPGWILAEDLEEIPYQTAHLNSQPVDHEIQLRALDVTRELEAARRLRG